jgi:uncharacterized protein
LRWIWDETKNTTNKRKHGLSFETAILVFEDPLAASRQDPYPREERWQTIGLIENTCILVIHTWPKLNRATSEETGRIISARAATARERKIYEEGEF